ncbi:MAG TPA: electron transfer flavoprotein subunit alpha/FixB family protein [Ignavibacteriaceae bacterium]|nr:electron transfer flavoprotein subunit alpha/FixB family protein [Ignavibacteriaceae bacterium]
MSKKVLAILEQRDGIIKKSSFEVLTFVEMFSKENEYESHAIILGSDIRDLEEMKKYFSGEVTVIKNDKLAHYSSSAYTDLITGFILQNNFDFVFLANTVFGKDLAPRVAVKTDAGLITDCIAITKSEDNFIAIRPVYAGKALEEVKIKTERKIYTLRQNVFQKEELQFPSDAETHFVEVNEIDLKSVVSEIRKSTGKIDVAEANIIVAGGRGMKGPEYFHLLEELAAYLGGAVGASRAVVDAGWRPHSEQVGQTGKTVSPNLYIACGISGAIQHMAGMSSSRYIVAINKDKDAPIFSIADYGIIGDVFEVLPALINELKKV